MSTIRHWDELTREEIGALAPTALTVIPVGSTEQHGPHLATGTDAALVTAIAERGAAAASRPDKILLAPTLAYGASDHHLPFGATLSLRVETFQRVLADLLSSAARAGCRRVFILNGHGGNTAACAIAAAEASREHGLLCASAIYSQLLEPGSVAAPVPGHAGQFETSLMLAVAAARGANGQRTLLAGWGRARPAPRSRRRRAWALVRARRFHRQARDGVGRGWEPNCSSCVRALSPKRSKRWRTSMSELGTTIAAIETTTVSLRAKPTLKVRGARTTHDGSSFLLVRVTTSDGAAGYGEVSATAAWSGEGRNHRDALCA